MTRIATLITALLFAAAGAPAHADGKSVYDTACAGCHAGGVLGAPKFGNAADWAPRLNNGKDALYASALKGTAKGMPPKGGRTDLPDGAIRSAVDYMLGALPSATASAPKAAPAAKPEPKDAAKPPAAPPAAAQAAPREVPAPVRTAVQRRPRASVEANAFNRLLKPPSRRNLPPWEDGIHESGLDGTRALQAPREAFAMLPKSTAGNRVDWVKALEQKRIAPRWDREGKSEPTLLDLNIVREVKGSMPDVVYPHKQHTEWLDCSNCHPAIFVPQKGANQISMAAILLGQKCGVCHGKVAFPVSECRLCHSKKKGAATRTAER